MRRGFDIYFGRGFGLSAASYDRLTAELSVGGPRRFLAIDLDFRRDRKRGSTGRPREVNLGFATIGVYFGPDDGPGVYFPT